ncbi:hypothetical protein V8C86DRAFT_3110990, partial [Haematococcus lacustris]
PLTPDKKEYLEGIRSQLGLTPQQADKAMAAARTEVFGTAAAPEEGGKWTLERVLELAKSGGKVTETVDEPTRRALFRREFEKRVSDGTGKLNPQFVLKELPILLGLEDKRVMSVVKELVGSRRRLLLVQAVSQHRQKRSEEMVTSLLDLLSCSRALPEASTQGWGGRAELKEVYAAFCKKVPSPEQQQELAAVMGLSVEEVGEVREELLVGAAAAGRAADDNASIF